MREMLGLEDELEESCGIDLGRLLPKTLRKKPGFSLGADAGLGAISVCLRVATVGEGAGGSWNVGIGGRSLRLWALTNS